MVLDKLGESLKNTLSKIAGAMIVDEKLVNELVKDLQKSLLQADVNVKLVFELTTKIRKRALDEKTQAISKKDHLVTIVYEELVEFLGGEGHKIEPKKKPYKIMLVGLFGNGKTTTAGKLAKFFTKRGKKVALISTDTWRPAALKQLEQLGKSIKVPVYGDAKSKDPVKVYEAHKKSLEKNDIVIIDTAGRDALNDELVKEISDINKAVKPNESFLVIGGDVGQAAEKQAQMFHDTVGVTGVIATKMEGTAKGGGALAACAVTGANVKFLGIGEKIDDLEEFEPKRFVGKMLGMGDLEGLLEKAKDAIDEDKAQDLGKRFLKGEFNLLDMYEQMEAVKKMGPIGKVLEMVPGMGSLKIPKEALQVQEEKLRLWKYIMGSCTKEELENPEMISSSRVERIAKGSGVTQNEVRGLVKQYKQSKKMMKMLKGGDEKSMDKLMKKMNRGGMSGLKF
ncbi:signal recognition particle protein [Candidatus Woesearchaeota archaeon]|nr:signal recognition particle protein [Candidatus Woesearchaeota archaeon]